MNNELIEKVVKEVFEVLSGRQSQQDGSSETVSGTLLRGSVITEELLKKETKDNTEIIFEVGAIITPSAKDFLRENRIGWKHESRSSVKTTSHSAWKVFVVTPSEQVENLLKEIQKGNQGIEVKLSSDMNEAVSEAVSGICRADFDSGVILTDSPEEAACLSNRQEKVKAVSVSSIENTKRIRENWEPNLYCLMPAGSSYFELRNLLRTITGQ